MLLGVVRLLLARQRGDLPAAAEEARRLHAAAEARDGARQGRGEDLRALALISLGTAEASAARFEEAERHLEQGIALARRIGRPYLEFTGLAHQARSTVRSTSPLAAERTMRAIELARRHGWTDEPIAGTAYGMLAVLALAGAAGRGRALGPARRAHRPAGGRSGGGADGLLRPRAA